MGVCCLVSVDEGKPRQYAGSEVESDSFHEIFRRGNHENLRSEKIYKLPLGYVDYENILFFLLGHLYCKLFTNKCLQLT